MANIEHKLIADADRHEPKGASTATVNQVLKFNGDGTSTPGFVSYNDITNKPIVTGYQQVLYGSSTASNQQPGATNTPLQVEFGVAQTLTDVTLSSAGLLTFLTAGQYSIEIFLRLGRTTAAGSAIMFSRILKNGVQSLNSNSITLVDSAQTIPFSATLMWNAAVNDTFAMQIMRDSAGINNGGLFQTTPSAAGWNLSPSASILVSKFKGIV